ELLGGGPKLHDEVAGNVLRLNLAPLLAPKADQSRLVAAHDNPGVGAADKSSAVRVEALDRVAHDFAPCHGPSVKGMLAAVLNAHVTIAHACDKCISANG